MNRFDFWPKLLDDFIASRRDTPFAWGAHDCCLFACDAVLAMTGEDLAEEFRGKYDSALGAQRVLKEFGCETVGELASRIAQKRSLRELPHLYAQRGDVVLVVQESQSLLAIVTHDGTEVWCPGKDKLELYPLERCDRAWRI